MTSSTISAFSSESRLPDRRSDAGALVDFDSGKWLRCGAGSRRSRIPRHARLHRRTLAVFRQETPNPRRARSEPKHLPPSSWASFRVSGSPRPTPLTRFCKGFSIWPYSSKIRFKCSAAIPIPLSLTEKMSDVAGTMLNADADLPALGEFHGVRQEVPQDLADLSFIGAHGQRVGRAARRSRKQNLCRSLAEWSLQGPRTGRRP